MQKKTFFVSYSSILKVFEYNHGYLLRNITLLRIQLSLLALIITFLNFRLYVSLKTIYFLSVPKHTGALDNKKAGFLAV